MGSDFTQTVWVRGHLSWRDSGWWRYQLNTNLLKNYNNEEASSYHWSGFVSDLWLLCLQTIGGSQIKKLWPIPLRQQPPSMFEIFKNKIKQNNLFPSQQHPSELANWMQLLQKSDWQQQWKLFHDKTQQIKNLRFNLNNHIWNMGRAHFEQGYKDQGWINGYSSWFPLGQPLKLSYLNCYHWCTEVNWIIPGNWNGFWKFGFM